MSDNNRETRKERYKSKGRSSMIMQLAVGLVALIVVVFLFNLFLGGVGHNKDSEKLAEGNSEKGSSLIVQKEESAESEEGTEESSSAEASEDKEEKDQEKEKEKDKKELEKNEVDSDDPNVIRAVVGDWQPIGTTQAEPHVTNYDDGSQDRLEIKQAVSQATEVSEGDMIENWIGNNGEQKVTSTITQTSTGKIFKTYLSWVANKGWQVTRVEELHQVIR